MAGHEQRILARVAVDVAIGHRVEEKAEREDRECIGDAARGGEQSRIERNAGIERRERKRQHVQPLPCAVQTKKVEQWRAARHGVLERVDHSMQRSRSPFRRRTESTHNVGRSTLGAAGLSLLMPSETRTIARMPEPQAMYCFFLEAGARLISTKRRVGCG